MSNVPPAARRFSVKHRPLLMRTLLTSVSTLALFVAGSEAQARPFGSANWPSPSVAAAAAAQSGQADAERMARQAQDSLRRATSAIQALQQAQQAARNAAANTASAVTNGLSAGGLIVDPRVKAGDSSLWQNISQPSQTVSGGQTAVTLTQTSQRAIATWGQFNVGRDTTVYFDQRAGNTSNGNAWVVLNRVDATGSPSQILGAIKAEGTVLLINPNGIIFGGTSQINVHTLIASAMDLNSFTGPSNGAFKQNDPAYVPVLANGVTQRAPNGTLILAPSDEANANTTFLSNGLFVNIGVQLPGMTTLTGSSALFSAGLVPGQGNIGVRVEAGASISSGVSGFDNGGFVALLGPQVTNAGAISSPAGEIILAAGSSVQIAEPAANSTQTSFVVRAGSGISGTLLYAPPAVSGGALVLNDTSGLLVSRRGNVTLNGDAVAQLGIVEATTSITRPGSITIVANGLDATDQVVFGGASLTTILPEENGETIPSDAASLANFTAPRIDIAAPVVDFQSGSWVLAPSASMTVTGPGVGTLPNGTPLPPGGRVLMEAGSTIDLSGLTATRSVTDYLYTFKVTSNDVADTPLAQNLIGKTVTIDLSLSGTRADGETWVGSPLFASSGASYLANITQGIDQLLTRGGSLTFGSGPSYGNGNSTSAFADVLQAPGAVINVSGGLIQYTGARISTTQLVGSDGRRYDIGSANPFLTNTIQTGFTVTHPRWNVTEMYLSPLQRGGYYKPGYVDGISAGSVAITALNPIIEGDLAGDIVIGTQQRRLAQAGTGAGGAQATPGQLPNGASLTIALAADGNGAHDAVILDASAPHVLGSGFEIGSSLTLPTNTDGVPVITYATDSLSGFNLGSVTISGADTLVMAAGASLAVRAGGSIKLTGATMIDGTLIAHGGSITIGGATASSVQALATGALPPLAIGAHALLDVSGQWINDTGHYGDDATGALFINGGSVSVSAYNLSEAISYDSTTQVVTAVDRSGSLILAPGSVIDASSGGYVGGNGQLALGADGVAKGRGGNLSLLTYAGAWKSSTGVTNDGVNLGVFDYAPQTATNATVVMNGAIYAGGLSQGGTFSLQAPAITIDRQATAVTSITAGADAGTVVLPTSLFTDSGFGSFKLTSTYGSVTVTAGTNVTLRQQTYVVAPAAALPASGARLRDFASRGFALDGMRHAVDLTLTQTGYVWGAAGDPSATAQLLISQGASIVGDPLATISLNAGGPAIVLGRVTAPGGTITINQGIQPQFPLSHDGLPQYVWIGADAVLDVAGTFVPDPRIAIYATGSVLGGGSITLSSSGVIVALAGSVFDIAGSSAMIEGPAANGLNGPRLATQQVWSNGGSLSLLSTSSLAAAGSYNSLYFAGTINASGGAAQAAGGTLNISNLSGILLRQDGDAAAPFAAGAMPATRAQLLALLPTTTATSFISADTISSARSGLDTVSFSGPLYFSGNVDLKMTGSVLIDNKFQATTLLPAGTVDTASSVPACTACIPSIGGTDVTLEAGYVRFYNDYSFATISLPTLADGTLTLKASQGIDLVGVPTVNNAGTVNLVSGGGIRLTGVVNFGSPPIGAVARTSAGYGGMPWVGSLLVADNLNLTAREIYPTTDTAFLLMSLGLAPAGAAGTHGTIAFASNGQTPIAPLSAGGAIIVDAKAIVQGGALYAPLGTIQLGFGANQTLPGIFINGVINNPYDPVQMNVALVDNGIYRSRIAAVATDSVTLSPGSLTSVSANGLAIPYGTTTDGTDWTDNGTLLNGPPAKLLALGGARVDTQAGAVIDGTGGGDVYATEFVPGTGGSRNVLTTSTQTVYALVPGYGSTLAAYDPSFTTTVAAGTTVTLPGGNGIAAGTYTLLPAEYATVPGAYRVVVVATGSTNQPGKAFTTPDGSIYMSGVLGNAINGSRASQTAVLQIQSSAVWRSYSEIDIARGSSYFAALAAAKATAVPRLAEDAARLVVTAGTSLMLNATNRFAPAAGGLGGQLDITGANLVVAASDRLDSFGTVADGVFTPSSDYAGYLFLDADMLSRLGIESTLIGGYRGTTTQGTLVTATALNLDIATDAAHPLSGPELLFTSLAPTAASPTVRGLSVDAGSVIAAQGTVAGRSPSPLVFGVNPVATYNSNGSVSSWSTGVSGDGALLRISNGSLVDIERNFVPGVYQVPTTTPAPAGPVSTVALGSLSVGDNVTLLGKTLTLDSSGATTVSVSANLTASNYDLSGAVINLGSGTGGLVISTGLIGKFAGADIVRLRSASVFNLYGNNNFGDAGNRIGTLTLDGAGLYSDGGTTAITARDIVFVNTQSGTDLSGANTSGAGGSLIVDASGTLIFGAGSKTLSGLAGVTATAGSQVLFTGTGSLDAKGAAVVLTAPLFLVDASTSQSLRTTGALTLAQGAGAAPAVAPTVLGGVLSLTGGSISVGGSLVAQGGSLTLEATTGALSLSGNALLSAAGTRIAFGDLIQDTPAGNIRLYADLGDLTLNAGSTVDVSGAGSGYAGTLSIYAGGTAGLYGTLKGAARYNDLGGELALVANRLDGGLPLGAGFTRSFEVSLGQGAIVIGAGQTLTSADVLLVANTGGIFIDGTIDASSASGGSIALYGAGSSTALAGTAGASGVTIGSSARLYARYQAPDVNSPGYAKGTSTLVQKGGTITLGTTGTPDGTLNAAYGYQTVQGSGAITVASGAIFDVSGGPGGANIDNTGGSVILRAPILTSNAINVSFGGTIVTNAGADGTASGNPLVVNAFAVWSTTDNSTDPGKHFDGIIDPAGFFDASGTRIISADANGLYPTSTADAPASGADLSHVTFYQTTLLDFVNNPFDTNAVASRFAGAKLQIGSNAATAMPSSALHLRPEIDLVNPTPSTGPGSINNGNITVASNWNFGAGSIDGNGVNLLYRTTDGREPGTLILRAANNVNINATITDGFFADYVPGAAATDAASLYAVETNSSLYQSYLGMFASGVLQYNSSGIQKLISNNPTLTTRNPPLPAGAVGASASFFSLSQTQFDSLQFQVQAPTVITGSAEVIDQYNQYYALYLTLFNAYATDIVSLNTHALLGRIGTPASTQTDGPALLSYSDYVAYITKARAIQATSTTFINPLRATLVPLFTPPTAPTTGSAYYDIAGGIGALTFNNTNALRGYTTDASDYATLWTAYFFTVANANTFNTLSTNAATLPNVVASFYGGGTQPTLENVAGLAARYGILGAIAVTPPYAPPAYTTLQPGYASSLPAPSSADQIANNPGTFRSGIGNLAVYNSTSSADLMTAAVSGKGSFSYDVVGGAAFNASGASSVNPNAVVQLSTLSSSLTGNVTVDGHTSYSNPLTQSFDPTTVDVPTLVRTGTGSITITAAGDFALLDTTAPGAVYTAGHVADNAAGFTVPTLPGPVSNGLVTTPVWATGGGGVTVRAGRDIVGIETPTDPDGTRFTSGIDDFGTGLNFSIGVSTGQFWSAWYFVNGRSTGSATAPFDPAAGGVQYSTWINYGTFFQGFGALGGGNITLQAGRNVQDVSASLPETIQVSGGQSASGPAATAHDYGGGNLRVTAGNDVLSGVYYVGRGTGLIRAGGEVVSDATLPLTLYNSNNWMTGVPVPTITDPNSGQPGPRFSVPLMLAVQDGHISVQAAGSIDLGGVFQPTRIPAEISKHLLPYTSDQNGAARTLTSAIGAAFDSYGPNSGVALLSSTGSIAVNTLEQSDGNGSGVTDTLFTHVTSSSGYVGGAEPASITVPDLSVTALTGDIQLASAFAQKVVYLYPSPTGQLSLVAGGSIDGRKTLGNGTDNTVGITMLDTDSYLMRPMLGSLPAALTVPLHTGDDVPALIYAGEDIDSGTYTLLKQARLWAGRDVANITFTGMNTADGDITSIVAGRDVRATRLPDVLGSARPQTSVSLTLYGPGDFVIEAGRDLGPFNTYGSSGGGIFAIGDGANNSASLPTKPYLPQQGANISLRYGVAGGIDYAAAIATYGDAATAAASGIDFVSGIIPQLEQIADQLITDQAKAAGIANPNVAVTLNPAEAGELFTALPTLAINDKLAVLAARAGLSGLAFNLTPAQFLPLQQQQQAMKLAIDSGFHALLTQVSKDYKDPASRYFGQYGRAYQAIATLFPASLGYTDNSAGGTGAVPALSHTGDLRMARSLVETQTGGNIDILGPGGNAYVGSNSADALASNQQGILTLQGGSVRSYTDGSVLIYQSRIFTEQGGNIELFSANGDLNAGKGPKSSAAYPPLKLICDVDGYCRVNPSGLVTGAGVGALLSVPGQDPANSNVVLAAPHGTVDFGAAGVRVAGDFYVVALQVLNAFNANVGGVTIGLPTTAAPNTGALTTAGNVAGAAIQTAAAPKANPGDQPSVVIVEVLGYGGGEGDGDEQKKPGDQRSQKGTQDSASPVQVIGGGTLGPAQRSKLTATELRNFDAP